MSVEHLEFRLLKYIVAIADVGSFTAAAAKLHLAQCGGPVGSDRLFGSLSEKIIQFVVVEAVEM